jgi:hypothetical protein
MTNEENVRTRRHLSNLRYNFRIILEAKEDHEILIKIAGLWANI